MRIIYNGDGNDIHSIELPHTVINGLINITSSVWVQTSDSGQAILSGARKGSDNEYLIWIVRSGKVTQYIKNGQVSGDGLINDGQWHHVVVTRDGDSGLVQIFVDGDLTGSRKTQVGPLSVDAGGFWVGNEQDSVGGLDIKEDFLGDIDDIRIYNRVLSESEIQELHSEINEPPSVTCSDDPATYSNETRHAILPCLEIPLYTDVNGTPIEFTGLYSAVLEIPFGFSNFEVKELTFLEIIEKSNPNHARFNPDSRILDIPRVDVPATVPLLVGGTVPGPALQCHVKLQQSTLRAEVLILQDFDCNLP